MFTKNDEAVAVNNYEKNIKPYLKRKDGRTHIIIFSKTISTSKDFDCEVRLTLDIDTIISKMQELGYDIIDVKFNTNKKLNSDTEIIASILYK